MSEQTIWKSESGAASSDRKPEYRLVPFSLIRRVGQRMTGGARKYGEWNWQKGVDDRTFMMDRANHAVEHLYLAIDKLQRGEFGDGADDDLSAAATNIAFLIEYQEFQRRKAAEATAAAAEPAVPEACS